MSARIRHLVAGAVTIGALVAAYVALNAPSASIAPSADPLASSATSIASSVTATATNAIQPSRQHDATRLDSTPTTSSPSAMIKLDSTPTHPASSPTATINHAVDSINAMHERTIDPINALETTPPPYPPEPADPSARRDWTTATVNRHDTLSRIFARHGLRVAEAYAVAGLEQAGALRRIRPGRRIAWAADERGRVTALRYAIDRFSTLHAVKRADAWRAEVVTRSPEVRLRRARATIASTLLAAADGIGMDFEAARALANIFGWQVDFNRELRSGDRFAVIFEELHLDGEKVGNGDIIAAELIVSQRRLRAIRHLDADGRAAYYAPNGDGIESSFLRSPLEFARVTSKFARKRFHPVLKKWRAHRGVDYGAARGTPVRATGDGVITRAAREGGYGNAVRIRHGDQYTTLYAHLRGFAAGVAAGARVRQGDVIGYVGSTGWATGAHLHYEFRVNGTHRNPLTVDLPSSAPVAASQQVEFLRRAETLAAELDRIGAGALAKLEPAQ